MALLTARLPPGLDTSPWEPWKNWKWQEISSRLLQSSFSSLSHCSARLLSSGRSHKDQCFDYIVKLEPGLFIPRLE
ncbi:hypothetical protein PAMP_017975 [Pampus punctatissimus]